VLSKRLNQFNAWVTAFNSITGSCLALCFNPVLLTLDSAWLSGFADAEQPRNKSYNNKKDKTVNFIW